MPTKNQKTGTQGENIIQKKFNCPKCKKVRYNWKTRGDGMCKICF